MMVILVFYDIVYVTKSLTFFISSFYQAHSTEHSVDFICSLSSYSEETASSKYGILDKYSEIALFYWVLLSLESRGVTGWTTISQTLSPFHNKSIKEAKYLILKSREKTTISCSYIAKKDKQTSDSSSSSPIHDTLPTIVSVSLARSSDKLYCFPQETSSKSGCSPGLQQFTFPEGGFWGYSNVFGSILLIVW